MDEHLPDQAYSSITPHDSALLADHALPTPEPTEREQGLARALPLEAGLAHVIRGLRTMHGIDDESLGRP